jgi:hypothetical protein
LAVLKAQSPQECAEAVMSFRDIFFSVNTMTSLISILDLLAMMAALAAAFLWWQASSRTVRRISRFEELDAADINRIVVAINRNQLINRQAALATAASAFLAALHFAVAAVLR